MVVCKYLIIGIVQTLKSEVMKMNERHEAQLKLAHQLYSNRDLKQELLWQREFLDTGYLSYQQVCFNKWIFDESLKRLEKLEKIGQIVNSEVDPNICNNFGDVRKVQAIKQIVNNYDGSMPSMIKQFSEIQKVLEQE